MSHGEGGVGGLQGCDFLHLDRSTISPFGTVAVLQRKLGCSTALHAFSPTYFLLAWRSHGVINQTAVPGEELDAKDQKKHTENQKISLSKAFFFFLPCSLLPTPSASRNCIFL